LVLPGEEENTLSNPVIYPSPSLAAEVSLSLHHFFAAIPGATARFPHRHHTTPPYNATMNHTKLVAPLPYSSSSSSLVSSSTVH